jgi:uncharacterized protein (TIGR03435 family)
MLRITALCLLFSLAGSNGTAQDTKSARFEVASVKMAARDEDAPSFKRGGPGTEDPERILYQRQQLVTFVSAAYGLTFDQISGPSWMGTELYSVEANVSVRATKEEVQMMWRNVLAERFHLKVHTTQKTFPVYELVVVRNNPRLQRSGEDSAKPQPGFPVPRAGEKWALSTQTPGTVRQTFRQSSMGDLAKRLAWPLMMPGPAGGYSVGRVTDRTGLDGLFDFTLEFAGNWGPGGAFPPALPEGQADNAPNMFEALQRQLGLKLEEKSARLDVLVIDSVDKMPTAN